MSQLRALRRGGLDRVIGLGSQQVARSNAARASAALMRQRREREEVDAFLLRRLDSQVRPTARTGTHPGTAHGTA